MHFEKLLSTLFLYNIHFRAIASTLDLQKGKVHCEKTRKDWFKKSSIGHSSFFYLHFRYFRNLPRFFLNQFNIIHE